MLSLCSSQAAALKHYSIFFCAQFLFPRGEEEEEEGFFSNLRLVCFVYSVFIWEIDFFVYWWTEAFRQPQSFTKKLNTGRHRWHVYSELYEWLVIRPAWICFLPSLFAVSSRSADLFEPPVGRGGTFEMSGRSLSVESYRSPCRWPFTANRCWRPCALKVWRSDTRWQCESAASGHLAGCLDRGLCCQRLWDLEV